MLITLVAIWAMLFAAKGTPVGELLYRALVIAPARRLNRIHRGQILFFVLLAVVSGALIWLMENDGRMLVAMGLPDVLAFSAAIDLTALLDIAVVAVMATSSVRLRTVRAWLARRIAPRPRARRPRVRRERRERRPANDDEARPALAA